MRKHGLAVRQQKIENALLCGPLRDLTQGIKYPVNGARLTRADGAQGLL